MKIFQTHRASTEWVLSLDVGGEGLEGVLGFVQLSEGADRLDVAGVPIMTLLHGLHHGHLVVHHVAMTPAHGLAVHHHHVVMDLLLHHHGTGGRSQEQSQSYQTSHLARGRFAANRKC